jgi:hypothetical protein
MGAKRVEEVEEEVREDTLSIVTCEVQLRSSSARSLLNHTGVGDGQFLVKDCNVGRCDGSCGVPTRG